MSNTHNKVISKSYSIPNPTMLACHTDFNPGYPPAKLALGMFFSGLALCMANHTKFRVAPHSNY